MALKAFREALNEAMSEEMERDPSVFLMGEEVARYDGAYKVSKGMLARFGERRVIDAPISEGGFAGLGIGAAMAGLRPIIEMMTWNFGIQGFDQIINHAAKMHYMSGGQFAVPIVFRGPNGAAHMLSAQHSQNIDPMLSNVPGLKIISVSTPYDAKGLLKSAIRDPNPVIFLESEMMYGMKGDVPDEEYLIPIGAGEIKRSGRDVTLITWGKITHKVLAVAEELATAGIDCEVLDPRTLVPLDEELIFHSVRKTHRAVIIEENWPFASVGSQISDRIQCECFDDLDAPVLRVSQEAVPVPYAEHLEKLALPDEERIIRAVKAVCYKHT
ncbi:MAG: pyruvate dehydrogenase complex E1 component subunit beta [Deltaproteobacteria bacterium]|nr:pyruvate dehydrogenase complex E1 component subunit beta [Deltaproteobacteria bacterium]